MTFHNNNNTYEINEVDEGWMFDIWYDRQLNEYETGQEPSDDGGLCTSERMIDVMSFLYLESPLITNKLNTML